MVTACCKCIHNWQGPGTYLVINSLFFISQDLSNHSVVATGIAVLTGITRIEHPFSNFSDPWAGSIYDGNALATSLVKTLYAYVGWNNAFNVLAEVKSRDPVRTVRNASAIAMALAAILFLFINVAYIAAIPKSEIADPRYLVGALFFQRVFGESWAAKILPVMVTFSCLGNLVCVRHLLLHSCLDDGFPFLKLAVVSWH